MKPPKQNFLESYDSQQLLFPKDSSNKLSFSISNIYKTRKIKLYRTTRKSKCFHPRNQNFIHADKENFLFLFFFYLQNIRKARKKEHTQIRYKQKSKWRQRSVNYHDSGTDPFSKTGHVSLPGHSIGLSLLSLPPSLLLSFLPSFLFVDHGRDQRKSPLKGEPSVVAKPLERNHRWRSAKICERSLAIFLDLFVLPCPLSSNQN